MYLHGSFFNTNNENISVEILTNADRSVSREIGDNGLFFADDPLEISPTVNSSLDTILGYQATLRLISESFIPSLFCADCRNAVISVKRNGSCIFSGFIEPQAYAQSYAESLDVIELSCIDALTALQYFKYRDTVDYTSLKAEASQRTVFDILKEIIIAIASPLLSSSPALFYDGSKAVNASSTHHYSLLNDVALSELLFIGDTEDDLWSQKEVVDEILKYLGLHITQIGADFFLFSWPSVKSEDNIFWQDLFSNTKRSSVKNSISISSSMVADADTAISIGEVFSQISLSCELKSVESVISSPLEASSLISPFANRQLYLREYSSDGNGSSAKNAFLNMVLGNSTPYEGASITDWFFQVMGNENWSCRPSIDTSSAANQHVIPNTLASSIGAAILSLGKIARSPETKKASSSKISMENFLVISVNGNENDDENATYPSANVIKEAIPLVSYVGNTSGGVFSPADDVTTNYLVLSGSVILNPVMPLSNSFGYIASNAEYLLTVNNISTIPTVPSRNNNDGRFYTQQFFSAASPLVDASYDSSITHGFSPFTDSGPQQYEFNYSAIGDSVDHVDKVAVLACMLVIGDKCVVETGTSGSINDFEWQTFKTLDQCADEDEYYAQSFTIGFNPSKGDFLIGTKFSLQNLVTHAMGIDAEGIAIPIRKTDNVNGKVQFSILGPVNTIWNEVTRRHPTFFRHTSWSSTSVPLLAHTSSIFLQDFEVKIYSDNGLINTGEDCDLIYLSEEKSGFCNVKDLSCKISSALSSIECQSLGVNNSVNLSTPWNVADNEALRSLYDYASADFVKPEQWLVDQTYQEFHAPRVEMSLTVFDNASSVSPFSLYRSPSMDKTFFVLGISRNIASGTASLSLKELDTSI